MSALPPKADITERHWHVRFVPEADITLSELGAIFAGNFVQLLLASLYWWYAGSRSYFTEKTFQPGRCNGPEQNEFIGDIFKAMPTIHRNENRRTFANRMAHIIKNQTSVALNHVEGLVHIEVSVNRDTYANRDLLSPSS